MSALDELELDSILLTIENPIRRKLLRRLSQEPSYQLQLSKELGFSQQLVAKHLDTMEDSGVLSSLMESSPHGPKRKEYLLNKSISVTIDFAPNLYRAKVTTFDSLPDAETPFPAYQLVPRVQQALRGPSDGNFGPLGGLVADIDRKLGDLEDERSVLLYIRHLAMKEVAKVIGGMRIPSEKKKILYHIIDQQNKDVEGISRALNLREGLVKDILDELNKNLQV